MRRSDAEIAIAGAVRAVQASIDDNRPSGLPALSEARFQAQVVMLARLHRWLTYHTYDSRRSTAGVPDLLLVRPPRVIFAELKRDVGTVSPAQRVWLDRLGACGGVETYCWRPRDWALIERILSADPALVADE